MSRLKFLKGRQKQFLSDVKKLTDLSWDRIAAICKVHPRTFRDWKREKYQMSYEALTRLHKALHFSLPRNIEVLPEYWSIPKAAKAGGEATARLYGGPGTPEGRRKGGINSQKKFHLNPEYAKELGFKLRKEIKKPEKGLLLAEFIGIMLGDGHIDKYQITVSMNNKVDREYSLFVSQIIKKLFGVTATMRLRENTLVIVRNSKNLIDYLIGCGLKRGDKINQQIDMPRWIFEDKEFIKGCLRGLIDTDGGIYYHNHTTKGIKYRHIGLCFTSRSLPLLKSVEKMLLTIGLNVKTNKKDRLFLYGREEVGKYLSLIGTNNPKNLTRYQSYKASKEHYKGR